MSHQTSNGHSIDKRANKMLDNKYGLGRYFCRSCADKIGNESVPGEERFSMGIYAGMYCDECWENDGRNHDRQFDPMDAGEHCDESDY